MFDILATSRHICLFSTQTQNCFLLRLALRWPLQLDSYGLNSLVADSDSLYHRLFSIPCMVEMLVREFVPEALAAGLDFSRLQRVNTKFHTDLRSARRRE